jgi:hypothetical protein
LLRVINPLRHGADCENLHTVYDIQHPVNEHPADFFVNYHTALSVNLEMTQRRRGAKIIHKQVRFLGIFANRGFSSASPRLHINN